MASIGDALLTLLGNKDPRQQLMQAMVQSQGGTPSPGVGTPAAAAGAPGMDAPAAPPQRAEAYQPQPDLVELYGELMKRNDRAKSIDSGIGLIAASLAQPENRQMIMASQGVGVGGGGGQMDPMGFVSTLGEMQTQRQTLEQRAAMRANLPLIARQHGLDMATAQYLFDTGELDAVLKELTKPNRTTQKLADGTIAVIDQNTGQPVGSPYGPQAVPDATADHKNWQTDEADRQARGLPSRSFTDFMNETGRAKAGASNLGPTGIDYGNPESGYVWQRAPDGSISVNEEGRPIQVPIAGGSVEQKAADDEAQKEKRAGQSAIGATIVGANINDILDVFDRTSESWTSPITGMMGAAASYVPGSPAHQVSTSLETIRANIGFNKLQEMREASPTGGALGQVSDFENRLLQSTYGNLSQAQNEAQFFRNLFRVRALTTNVVHNGIKDEASAAAIMEEADRAAQEFLSSRGIQDTPDPREGPGLVDKYRTR